MYNQITIADIEKVKKLFDQIDQEKIEKIYVNIRIQAKTSAEFITIKMG